MSDRLLKFLLWLSIGSLVFGVVFGLAGLWVNAAIGGMDHATATAWGATAVVFAFGGGFGMIGPGSELESRSKNKDR